MKRSFYEMLDISRDADQPRIDIAYRQAKAQLSSGAARGATEAVMQARLLEEGYKILSDPEQRTRYDAKLAQAEQEVEITLLPVDPYARRRLGIGTIVLAVLAAVLGTILYHNLSVKMDEVRVEHAQAVIKHQEEQPKGVVIDRIYNSPTAMKADTEAGRR